MEGIEAHPFHQDPPTPMTGMPKEDPVDLPGPLHRELKMLLILFLEKPEKALELVLPRVIHCPLDEMMRVTITAHPQTTKMQKDDLVNRAGQLHQECKPLLNRAQGKPARVLEDPPQQHDDPVPPVEVAHHLLIEEDPKTVWTLQVQRLIATWKGFVSRKNGTEGLSQWPRLERSQRNEIVEDGDYVGSASVYCFYCLG